MPRKIIVSLCLALFAISGLAQESRHFTFHYAFTVKNLPTGKRVRIWIPAAHSDAYQNMKVISSNGDVRLKRTSAEKYGNEFFYAEATNNEKSELHFDVEYEVVRHERIALGTSGAKIVPAALTSRDRQQDLQPDALVPITGLPAELAAKVTQGKSDTIAKAHAIYDYVFTTLRYDKTGTGWGRGDVLYACDAKKGNCTDFHSLFIAMARSQGIPARFEIGFSIPDDKHAGEIAGYHCWSDFYVDGEGWIPVDISEAWKHPEKRDYFFGTHDANRIEFSMGRDLELDPQQDGKPLNYFVYPYVEVDGKEYGNVSLNFSFADMTSTVVSSGR
ncbi:MAG TPA: transglutaminase-like domain-containing protein [Candidatus Sulfotelmatobacter sp.]|nr:transglutaminase-like domain-containing protein [Candidatus Sulfotelmatobacter sp.]